MFEAFKFAYAAGLGIFTAALTGLAVLGAWDWLMSVITRIRVAWYYWNQERRPTR